MAGMYKGIAAVARKVKNQYFGVAAVARKVKNGYNGVAAVARKFYSSVVSPLALMTSGTMDTTKGMWSNANIKSTNETAENNDGAGSTGLTITLYSSSRIHFKWFNSTNDNYYGFLNRLSDAIDMSGYSKLQFKAAWKLGEYCTSKFGVITSAKSPYTFYANSAGLTFNASKAFSTGEVLNSAPVTYTIDISAITGNGYIYLQQISIGGRNGSRTNTFELFDITLIE